MNTLRVAVGVGSRMRHMALAALALIVANVAYEFLLPLLNTRDPIDALYGVVGTLLAFAWMWIIHRFGLKPIQLEGDGGLRPLYPGHRDQGNLGLPAGLQPDPLAHGASGFVGGLPAATTQFQACAATIRRLAAPSVQ